MTDAPTTPLTADVRMPMVGFGTYLIPDEEVSAAVAEALRVGYRHVDTAEGYGNEAGVGRAIHSAIDNGVVARDDLFVTTKLLPGNPEWGQPTKRTAATVESLDASLQRLGLNRVDLYLIHAPFDPSQRLAAWRGLLEVREQGKTRAIGVSNVSATHITDCARPGYRCRTSIRSNSIHGRRNPNWSTTWSTTASGRSPTAPSSHSLPGGAPTVTTAPRPTR